MTCCWEQVEAGPYLVGGVSIPHDQLPVLRGTYQQPGERHPRSCQSLPLPPSSPGPCWSLTWSPWPSAWHRSLPGGPSVCVVSASGLVPPPPGQTRAAEKGVSGIRVSGTVSGGTMGVPTPHLAPGQPRCPTPSLPWRGSGECVGQRHGLSLSVQHKCLPKRKPAQSASDCQGEAAEPQPRRKGERHSL